LKYFFDFIDINATIIEEPKEEGFKTGGFSEYECTSYGNQDWAVTLG
jgi:hypothetical protein